MAPPTEKTSKTLKGCIAGSVLLTAGSVVTAALTWGTATATWAGGAAVAGVAMYLGARLAAWWQYG